MIENNQNHGFYNYKSVLKLLNLNRGSDLNDEQVLGHCILDYIWNSLGVFPFSTCNLYQTSDYISQETITVMFDTYFALIKICELI